MNIDISKLFDKYLTITTNDNTTLLNIMVKDI